MSTTRIRIPLPDHEGTQSATTIILEKDGHLTPEGTTLLGFIARHIDTRPSAITHIREDSTP